ncbi:MAG: HAMP domain-containing sensor histidine kinase [Ilumatobacteraceae bacterium]
MPADGIAVVTDLSGNVVEVLRDDVGLLGPADAVTRLADLVDVDSVTKLGDFLGATRADGAALEWEIRVRGHGGDAPLRFSAGRDGERLLVLIAADRADAEHLTGEMLRINNEQLNTYRSHMKDLESVGLSIDELDEFTRLNNDLANLQRELAKANHQLARTNAQKDQFLGMAAHELRSPLGVISSYAQFLDDEGEFDEEQRRMIATIRRTIVSMRQLVDELLDVAAIEAGRLDLDPEQVDLGEVVIEVAERQAPLATRKSVRLTLSTPDAPVIAEVDRAKLVQVLDNLVTNAIKFTHADGEVTVGAAAGRSGDWAAELSVADDGMGIPEESAEALFTPFSISRAGTGGERGTGLGLAIVKRIVDGHGGTISIDSQVDRGTTVTVRLPRRRTPAG